MSTGLLAIWAPAASDERCAVSVPFPDALPRFPAVTSISSLELIDENTWPAQTPSITSSHTAATSVTA